MVPRDELQEGFDLSDGPPVGPDGMPLPMPQVERSPPRPSLCTAGPCRHYHRLETQVEAADPRAQRHEIRVPDGTPRTEPDPGGPYRSPGTIYRPLPVFHTAVHHYCYPSSGIEIVLDTPVVTCNRYQPPSNYQPGTPAYERFERQLAEWEAARARDAADAAEAERVIAESLANKEIP